jgi:hypothetical protein
MLLAAMWAMIGTSIDPLFNRSQEKPRPATKTTARAGTLYCTWRKVKAAEEMTAAKETVTFKLPRVLAAQA